MADFRPAEENGLHHPWRRSSPAGTATVVAPGVKWLRLPLPFALDHINVWVLEDDEGWAIVDTGVGLADTHGVWERVFAEELDGKPVTRVIVTHFHPDHMGNGGWLTERWGVDLWSTPAEWLFAQLCWRMRTAAEYEPRLDHYRRHGADEAAIERFRRRGNHYPGVVPTLAQHCRSLVEGDVIRIGSRRWEVITLDGHAPDHVCLHDAQGRLLISGDQVLPKITTNISIWPDMPLDNPLRLYLDSLERFRPMSEDTLVLPSHGLPFVGLDARLGQLRRHHDARLAQTLDALGEPRTAAEIVPVLFPRQMDVHELSFAIGEALAHLNFLEAAGVAVRETGSDGIQRFRKA